MKVNVVDKSPERDIDDTSVDRAIEILEELRKQYTDDAKVIFNCDYECDTKFTVRLLRPETDEEYQVRLQKELHYEESKLIHKRNLLNQLKKIKLLRLKRKWLSSLLSNT